MRQIYKSLEKAAYRSAWGLTLALGMSCTDGKEEVKIAAPEPVKEAPALNEVQIEEPVYEELEPRTQNSQVPIKYRVNGAYMRLCNVVKSTKAWREGSLEEKRLEMDELKKYSKRFGDFKAGRLTDLEAQELIVEMETYTNSTMMFELGERAKRRK
ncbi:MAG: hypothetical protein HY512_01260 [Candidatus Aenigmarchaeota archaeon]|nr:hypothetical protein [Candidatus Aenigmarchaeota archaeon]